MIFKIILLNMECYIKRAHTPQQNGVAERKNRHLIEYPIV